MCILLSPALPTKAADFYVAPNGRDDWSGTLPKPNRKRTDGPFASLERARDAVRQFKRQQPDRRQPIVVNVRGGYYFLNKPFLLTPEDSGTATAPVIYTAYPGERPVFSGGRRLTGWKLDEKGRWQLTLPKVACGQWHFAQLFVNGARRYRPRLPKTGYYFIAGTVEPPQGARGYNAFLFHPGDIQPDWRHLEDVEVLAFQNWTATRLRIASVDTQKNLVRFHGATWGTAAYSALPKGNRYLVENVAEALQDPGEWYLDRKTGILTYIPMPSENPEQTEVIAPFLERLVEIKGDISARKWVQHITLRGLTLAHTNWTCPIEGQAYPQAEVNLGAAIQAEGARDCIIEACTVKQSGTYAVELGGGCKRNRIEDCVLYDLAGGGVKIGMTSAPEDDEEVASHNIVRNCGIGHGGRMHPAAVGVWIGHSHHNSVENNDILDFYYTGISVGWSWGYGRSLAHHNTIAYNHIFQIGQGVLSDMGGIYCLGVSPGTVLRGNVIHEVESFSYGGWGIYPDEGSTGLLIENNLVYRTKTGGFHQHYGKENIVRNNIFALAREGQIIRTRAEDHLSFTFERNIVYWKEGPLLGSNWSGNNYQLDYNLYWNAAGQPITFAGMTLEEWRKKGQDIHSIIADPLFENPERGDFRLKPGSPAEKIGFHPIDASKAGRHPSAIRPVKRLTTGLKRAFPPPPPPPPPQPIAEDFESTPVGQKAPDAETIEESEQATIRVTNETASSGKHSLKFVDAPGQQFAYNPHLFYTPGFKTGVMQCRFDLRAERGAVLYHEWRDGANPYHIGPSVHIGPDGSVTVGGKNLMQLPLGRWVGFEIVCGLGSNARGKFDLTIHLPGRIPPMRFKNLPCSSDFKELQWFGFVANGTESAVFYLDNIHLNLRKKQRGGE